MPNQHENRDDTNSLLEIADRLLTGALLGAGVVFTTRLFDSSTPSKSTVYPQQVGDFSLFRGDFYHLGWTDEDTLSWHVRHDDDRWIVHRKNMDYDVAPLGYADTDVGDWSENTIEHITPDKRAAIRVAINGMLDDSRDSTSNPGWESTDTDGEGTRWN